MLHPDYHLFKGILTNCQRLVLKFWDDEKIIEDNDVINALVDELEIANVAIDTNGVCVFCNRFGRFSDNRYEPLPGGYFLIVCEDIILFDEAGQAVCVDDLKKICRSYWHQLGKR